MYVSHDSKPMEKGMQIMIVNFWRNALCCG